LHETEAELARKLELGPSTLAPSDTSESKELLIRAIKDLEIAENAEAQLKRQREVVSEDIVTTEKSLAERQQAIQKHRDSLHGLRSKLEFLIRDHGDDHQRTAALQSLQQQHRDAEGQLTATRKALESLQPELLQRDIERFQKSIDGLLTEKQAHEKRLAVAQNQLRTDGTSDPQADCARADSRAMRAARELEMVQQRADAVKLLSELFVAEQQSATNRLMEPFLARIEGYLDCIFGAGSKALLSLQGSDFDRLDFQRPSFGIQAMGFSVLSAGAKEQVSAAVRLATAEILAQGHDGCLPLIFDDAFAYSDPARVSALHRMLDLAASRGLQIVVLSCNPADYTALGAKSMMLRHGDPLPLPN
jgi:DNA repair exonuclease SbcCD ATPase subunit